MRRLLIFIFILSLQMGCQQSTTQQPTTQQVQPKEISGQAMTIDYRILIGDPLNDQFLQKIHGIIDQTFIEINLTFNDWNPDSEISRLNTLPAHIPVAISPVLEAFLKRTGTVVELTGGLFDPTIAPVVDLWRDKLSQGLIPSQTALEQLKPAIGWDKIHFQEGLFWKDHPQTQLDLGGIAKGYCVDLLSERLAAIGCKNIYVSWGGEVRVIGQHPQHRPWIVALQSPFHQGVHSTIPLENRAVATSGDYCQYWLASVNSLYTHICHPHTLQALRISPSSVASATVIADSCMTADAIATALMLMNNLEAAHDFEKRLQTTFPGLTCLILARD